MKTQELTAQIMALTPAEKMQVIQILTQTEGITKTPGVCGGDACIAHTRIPVWSLVSDRLLGMTDAEILAAFPHLTAADLINVWAYFEAYTEEIETAIKEQEEAIRLYLYLFIIYLSLIGCYSKNDIF